MLDEALLRPGRFDLKIYMGRPTAANRLKILQAGPAPVLAHSTSAQPAVAPPARGAGERAELTDLTDLRLAHAVQRQGRSAAVLGCHCLPAAMRAQRPHAGQAARRPREVKPPMRHARRCTPQTVPSPGRAARGTRAMRCCTRWPTAPSATPAQTWPTCSTRPPSSQWGPSLTHSCPEGLLTASVCRALACYVAQTPGCRHEDLHALLHRAASCSVGLRV